MAHRLFLPTHPIQQVICSSLLSFIVACFCFSANAGETLIEEIVVTAEFRDTDVARVAASVSVLTPNTSGTVVNHLEEVLGQVPNVNFSSGASRARFIQIRGIGERGQFDEPLNSSVGLIVDGVDMSGVGTGATLFDVKQVEVLRGPQGTLYGANALAGLINVVTASPTEQLGGSVRLDAGDYGAFGLGAIVSGPVNEQLGYRIAAQRYRDDGYIDNDYLGRHNTNNRNESTYRAKLVYRGDVLDWQLVLGRADIENGYDAFSLDNNRTTLSDQPGFDLQQTDYAALKLSRAFTAVSFEASVSFADSDIDYGYDEDWTFNGFDPIGYSSVDRYTRDRQTTTVEGRWLSSPGYGLFGSQWDWAVGAFLLHQEVNLVRRYTFLTDVYSSDFEIDRRAVYGEISNEVSPGLRLTMGLRFEQHHSDYSDSVGVALKPEDDLFGGRILLEKDFASFGFVYGGISQGYKSGGFNTSGTLPAELREFDGETLWNLELGYKAQFFQQRLNFRAAVFRMQRDDVQVETSIQRPIVGGGGAVQFIQLQRNAAQGYNQGVELEVDYQATDTIKLFANVGLLDTERDKYVDGNGLIQPTREQAQAPQYQFFLGADISLASRWSLRLEAEGKDAYYFSANHNLESDAYELLHATLTYTHERWRVRLWGRNLADEDYFVRGFQFGNDPRDFYTSRGFTQLGEPRQYGLSIELDF